MAGKSNKNKSKSKSGTTSQVATGDGSVTKVMESKQEQGDASSQSASNTNSNDGGENANASTEDNKPVSAITNTIQDSLSNGEIASADPTSAQPQAEGELQLYPIAVKGPSGERIELQVNPGDSVMDLRQFLLDAPETCFYTCYDLIIVTADGSRFQLADYNEIGEIADVTVGGCELEMVNALYDERSVRTHLKRTRELLFITSIHSSLSTALALQHEAKQQKDAGEKKTDAPELEGLGFMEDSNGLIENLVPSSNANDITCVDSIAFSSFNPVPGYRRLMGDLIYLDIVTCEGGRYCVTGHTRGFYVNMTTNDVLDCRPSTPPHEASTLAGLLRQLSEKFTKGFLEVLEQKSQGHPFENVPSLLPLNPWLGRFPPAPHRRDKARAEDSLVLPFGIEMIGMQRDWNEELQSCREFPRKNLQDRIIRDRALYKVNCDFVDAAIKGAKGVIGRCIPPINPTDPERFHMYVHNNIFFSFAIDGDLNLMQQMNDPVSKGNDQESKKVDEDNSTAKPDSNIQKKSVAKEQANIDQHKSIEGVDCLSKQSESNVAVDMEAKGNSAPSQVIESEQATYASANNDLKGTKAYNNADVSGLCTLAMTIIDYRGHRIVAQSIIPGILQGDKSESLLYGSVDNGKKISWNEKFHSKILEAGKLLHIKEHEVNDASGNTIKIAAPVDCKGIVGSDDRQYLLDLMRTTPRDANFMGAGSRHCVLRPELVASFCQVEALEIAKQKKADSDEAAENEEELPAILLNPNVLTECKLAGNSEEITGDEELVKKAGKHLVDVVLPKFIQDMNSLEVSPMDGQTLTEALHAHGINVRYLGHVAKLAKHLPHIWDLCVKEMIVRAAKHVLKGVLRETQDHDVAGATAHFFNCFLGHDVPVDPENTQLAEEKTEVKVVKAEKSRKKAKAQKKLQNSLNTETSVKDAQAENCSEKNKNSNNENLPSYSCITSSLVWTDINAFVKFKYEFELPEDSRTSIRRISVLRNLCLKVGITIAARTYNFSSAVPFHTSDILDLHSVTKHSAPVCADARDLLETGKLRLAQGKLNEAYETFSEAFTILQQVCGPMHREVANCCRYLAMALYHAGDMAGAIMQQHKELIINERCLGLDHPDTAHSYGNMALFYHGLNQTELALRHMARTLLLLSVSCGSDHPDVAATFINVAMMYQDIGRMNVALRYLQEALKKNKGLLGEDHIQTAVCYHALAIAFNCMGAFKLSMQHEKSTHTILVKQLGEDDARTRDSANWLKTFQARDQQAQMQKGQAISVAAAAEAIRARPDLLQAFQAAAAVGNGGRVGGGGTNVAASAALMGDTSMPRNRGLDKRGARAAAEARKKAAAKGLNVKQPQGVPVQAVPPLNELLSLFENGLHGKTSHSNASPSSSSSLASNKEEIDKKAKTLPSVEKPASEGSNNKIQSNASENGVDSISEKENPEAVAKKQEKAAPLGLGVGLKDVKKSKQKAKISAESESKS